MAHFNENKTMNFSYLENLISSGAREINLDFDIVLDDFEAARYQHGIEIKRDNLIINGNGHVIDARNRTGIFLNQGQNIVFKNINFINGFSRDGWSVLVNFHGSMEISDCKFKNNVAELGTLVNMGQMKIQNCIIEDNRSRYAGGINNQEGSLEISASKFIGNIVPGNSGAVDVEGGSVDIMDCEFIKNESGRIGGAIFSIGKVRCRNTKFISNQAEFDGGAINNQPGAILELLNTEFINNKSDRNGGGISNAGKLTVKDSLFKDNYAGTDGGAINSQPDELINNNEEMIMPTGNNGDLNNDSKEDIYKSYAEISNSRFLNNKAKDIGGALTNWSKASIKDSLFESNEANYGGAVNNQPGARLELEDTLFEKNIASKIGAAVCNYGQMEALKNIFKNNNANGDGGAINNQPGARMNIDDCEFSKNSSKDAGGAIYNWEDLRINNGTFDENTSLEGLSIVNRKKTSISNSKFTNHTGNDIIINNNDLNIRDSIFEKNNSQSIIKNQEDGILSINYGSFNDNDNLKSTIYNIGKSCSIAESIFENNKSKEGYADIYNESELKLKSPQFKNTEDKTVFNKGETKIKSFGMKDAEKIIFNEGSINDLNIYNEEDMDTDGKEKKDLDTKEEENIGSKEEKTVNFTYLDELIHKEENLHHSELEYDCPDQDENRRLEIKLDHDVKIEDSELDFYEGGIVLDVDELIIDGCGHYIDGNGKTRIFYITGKNICLKNINFRNASLLSSFEKHSNGGGAIRTIKSSDLYLINCDFTDNYSDDDGGAILNNGSIFSLNTRFKQNESKSIAAAICNNSKYESNRDFFENNKSKIASIFNCQNLSLNGAVLSGENDMDNAVFNNGDLKIRNIHEDPEKIIFNAGCLNIENEEIKKVSEVFGNMADGPIAKISLEENIILDYGNEEIAGKMDNSSIPEENKIDTNAIITEENKIDTNAIITEENKINTNAIITEENKIDIDNTLIIEGNNHSIDFNNYSLLFNVKDTASIVFKDLIIKNLDSSSPFINNNGTVSFKNCRIINNSILNENLINNNESLILINTIFSNNYTNRPLINNKKKLSIIDNSFLINNNDTGTIISNFNECRIENSRFMHNVSKNKDASIRNELKANMEIIKSEFKDNYGKEAGSISNYNFITISECLFESNRTENEGGAINNQIGSELKIKNSKFIANASNNEGGAIKNKGKVGIIKSLFEKNKAKFDGGVLFNHSGGRFDIEDSIFKENNARIGGTIVNWNKIQIRNCEFEANHAIYGAAIYTFPRSSLDLLESRFKENISENGGVILKDKDSYLYFNECKFENNIPDNVSETIPEKT